MSEYEKKASIESFDNKHVGDSDAQDKLFITLEQARELVKTLEKTSFFNGLFRIKHSSFGDYWYMDTRQTLTLVQVEP